MVSSSVPVVKDENGQQPIPTAWRDTIYAITDAFKEGDFDLKRGIAHVRPIAAETASQIDDSVKEYGAHLTSLSVLTWQTSACQWMRGYWDVLIDLFTVEEGRSDLALALRVFEDDDGYNFVVQSIHVP